MAPPCGAKRTSLLMGLPERGGEWVRRSIERWSASPSKDGAEISIPLLAFRVWYLIGHKSMSYYYDTLLDGQMSSEATYEKMIYSKQERRD